MTNNATLRIDTTWGPVLVTARAGRICSCSLPEAGSARRNDPVIHGAVIRADAPRDRAVLEKAERFIRDLFAGRTPRLPAVEMPACTPFQKAVWEGMLAIPRGKTRRYGELAAHLDRPRAARAVGQACGRNEIPLFIPCHRILAAGNTLGGFTSGLAWKTFLLKQEGVLNDREHARS